MNKLPILPYIEMVITTFCNKHCANCSNYIPYIQDKAIHVRANDAIEQLDRLLNMVSYIDKFQIHGGEPLLNPELPGFVKFIVAQKKINHIRIATNGTIIPSLELLNALKNTSVTLAISTYSFNRTNIPKIVDVCVQNNVRYIVYNEQNWYKFSLNTIGKEVFYLNKFEHCPINCYPVFFDWKIYLCARICHAYSENGTRYYVDIRQTNNLAQALSERMLKEGCELCNITSEIIPSGC